MANESIRAALERLWLHINAKFEELGTLDTITDEEALEFVISMGYVNPLINDSDVIYTGEENVIYIL